VSERQIGYAFSPVFNNADPREGASGPPNSFQGPIQTLSFRYPRVIGAQALSPEGLLRGAGGTGIAGVNAAALESIMRALGLSVPGASRVLAGFENGGEPGIVGYPSRNPTPRVVVGQGPGSTAPAQPGAGSVGGSFVGADLDTRESARDDAGAARPFGVGNPFSKRAI